MGSSARVNVNHTAVYVAATKNEKGTILQTCTYLRIGAKDIIPQMILCLQKRLMQMLHFQTGIGNNPVVLICVSRYFLAHKVFSIDSAATTLFGFFQYAAS